MFSGISFERNVQIKQMPPRLFSNMNNLKYLRIVDPTPAFVRNLSLQLPNLDDLRITGTPLHMLKIPADFLHTS